MIKLILFSFLYTTQAFSTTSIFVEVYNNKVKVSKPEKVSESISIHFENKSNSDYVMKLVNDKFVIKRFTLLSNKTYSFDFFSKDKGLKVIPLTPAFRTIPLNKKERTYEISKI